MRANARGSPRWVRWSRRAACRRALLLRHFGENPPAACGNCDNCLEPPRAIDATALAPSSCRDYRTGQRFGVPPCRAGADRPVDERIVARGALSVCGIVSRDEARLIKPVARALLTRDALRATAHGGLSSAPLRGRF